MTYAIKIKGESADVAAVANNRRNKIQSEDLAIHNWYQFILGFPPHLVRHYMNKFQITKKHLILDPFCGIGTTPVECLKQGVSSYGVEANPIAVFASRVKTYTNYDLETLYDYLAFIYHSMKLSYEYYGIFEPQEELFDYETNLDPIKVTYITDLPEEQKKIIPKGFICPKPLGKVLIIKEIIKTIKIAPVRDFFLLVLANFIVRQAGNVRFGPEVGRTKPKGDVKSIQNFLLRAETMISDIQRTNLTGRAQIITGDARRMDDYMPRRLLGKVNCVITSPPYPNEKDYTRSTRLESVLLDFIRNKSDLRKIKQNLLRSNSRNIFVSDDDGECIKRFSRITSIAEEIESRRRDLKKTSGFEKHYHKIVLHYFGGMYRHLKTLKSYLSRDCHLAYVVGDQMSFFRILIPTAVLLGEIADSLGYKVEDIELWRTRAATATKMEIDENVLILKKK